MAQPEKSREETLEAFIATPEFSDVLSKIPDNRELAAPGDLVAAIWFPDQNWYVGIVEPGDEGPGFIIDEMTWGDLEGAYHAVVLSKAGTPRF